MESSARKATTVPVTTLSPNNVLLGISAQAGSRLCAMTECISPK